jgi:hypothetical protein
VLLLLVKGRGLLLLLLLRLLVVEGMLLLLLLLLLLVLLLRGQLRRRVRFNQRWQGNWDTPSAAASCTPGVSAIGQRGRCKGGQGARGKRAPTQGRVQVRLLLPMGLPWL